MKKIVALFILACFLASSVFADALHAVAGTGPGPARTAQTPGDVAGLLNYGRITGGRSLGSRQTVINIQDLHCHPEVQRNIAGILAALDRNYGLKNVFVEGGYGAVDTSRLCNIVDGQLRNNVIESLIDRGRLTGSEYYSVTANRPDLLRGIEDEAVHKANIVRLGKILEKKEAFAAALREIGGDLALLKANYFGPRNRDLDALIKQHRAGAVPSEKYYLLLGKYAEALSRESDRYHALSTAGLAAYPNIAAYLELSRMGRRLNYRKVSRQLQQFVRILKSRLPFAAYNDLLETTDNFSRTEELYVALARMAKEYRLDLSGNFPDLKRFLDYTEKSRTMNPVTLLREEKRLTGELRLGFSNTVSELDVSFLSDFYQYFGDYLLNQLSAEDYGYFTGRFGKFRTLWAAYAYKDRIAALGEDFALLDEFYAVNCERNSRFLANIPLDGAERFPAETGPAPDLNATAAQLLENGECVVMITGGFHSEGLKELLEQRGISYLVITPHVTDSAEISGATYEAFAREQARLLSQALQLGLASQLSSRALFELAIQAANERLREAGITDRERLVRELEKSIGVKAEFDPASGVITFDSGAAMRLEDGDGSLEVTGLSPARSVSGAVKASLENLLDASALAAAFGKALTGQVDDIVNFAAEFAARHYLIRGDGLPYRFLADEKLNKKETINGIRAELLARFPKELIEANAQYDRTLERLLQAAAERSDWREALLAIDLLRDFIVARAAEETDPPENAGGIPPAPAVGDRITLQGRSFTIVDKASYVYRIADDAGWEFYLRLGKENHDVADRIRQKQRRSEVLAGHLPELRTGKEGDTYYSLAGPAGDEDLYNYATLQKLDEAALRAVGRQVIDIFRELAAPDETGEGIFFHDIRLGNFRITFAEGREPRVFFVDIGEEGLTAGYAEMQTRLYRFLSDLYGVVMKGTGQPSPAELHRFFTSSSGSRETGTLMTRSTFRAFLAEHGTWNWIYRRLGFLGGRRLAFAWAASRYAPAAEQGWLVRLAVWYSLEVRGKLRGKTEYRKELAAFIDAHRGNYLMPSEINWLLSGERQQLERAARDVLRAYSRHFIADLPFGGPQAQAALFAAHRAHNSFIRVLFGRAPLMVSDEGMVTGIGRSRAVPPVYSFLRRISAMIQEKKRGVETKFEIGKSDIRDLLSEYDAAKWEYLQPAAGQDSGAAPQRLRDLAAYEKLVDAMIALEKYSPFIERWETREWFLRELQELIGNIGQNPSLAGHARNSLLHRILINVPDDALFRRFAETVHGDNATAVAALDQKRKDLRQIEENHHWTVRLFLERADLVVDPPVVEAVIKMLAPKSEGRMQRYTLEDAVNLVKLYTKPGITAAARGYLRDTALVNGVIDVLTTALDTPAKLKGSLAELMIASGYTKLDGVSLIKLSIKIDTYELDVIFRNERGKFLVIDEIKDRGELVKTDPASLRNVAVRVKSALNTELRQVYDVLDNHGDSLLAEDSALVDRNFRALRLSIIAEGADEWTEERMDILKSIKERAKAIARDEPVSPSKGSPKLITDLRFLPVAQGHLVGNTADNNAYMSAVAKLDGLFKDISKLDETGRTTVIAMIGKQLERIKGLKLTEEERENLAALFFAFMEPGGDPLLTENPRRSVVERKFRELINSAGGSGRITELINEFRATAEEERTVERFGEMMIAARYAHSQARQERGKGHVPQGGARIIVSIAAALLFALGPAFGSGLDPRAAVYADSSQYQIEEKEENGTDYLYITVTNRWSSRDPAVSTLYDVALTLSRYRGNSQTTFEEMQDIIDRLEIAEPDGSFTSFVGSGRDQNLIHRGTVFRLPAEREGAPGEEPVSPAIPAAPEATPAPVVPGSPGEHDQPGIPGPALPDGVSPASPEPSEPTVPEGTPASERTRGIDANPSRETVPHWPAWLPWLLTAVPIIFILFKARAFLRNVFPVSRRLSGDGSRQWNAGEPPTTKDHELERVGYRHDRWSKRYLEKLWESGIVTMDFLDLMHRASDRFTMEDTHLLLAVWQHSGMTAESRTLVWRSVAVPGITDILREDLTLPELLSRLQALHRGRKESELRPAAADGNLSARIHISLLGLTSKLLSTVTDRDRPALGNRLLTMERVKDGLLDEQKEAGKETEKFLRRKLSALFPDEMNNGQIIATATEILRPFFEDGDTGRLEQRWTALTHDISLKQLAKELAWLSRKKSYDPHLSYRGLAADLSNWLAGEIEANYREAQKKAEPPDRNGLILPENIPRVMQWKLEGRPDWWIALRIAFPLERRQAFLHPVRFYKEHGPSTGARLAGMAAVAAFSYLPAAAGIAAVPFLAAAGFMLPALAAAAAGLAAGIVAGGIAHAIVDIIALRNMRVQTISHIVASAELPRNAAHYVNDERFAHVWFTDLPDAVPEELSPLGVRAAVSDTAGPADVWAGMHDGSLVFYLDLKKAGIPPAEYESSLGRGAAQIVSLLGGTDRIEGDRGLRERVRKTGAELKTALAVDHFGNAEKMKAFFSDAGLHRVPVVPGDLFRDAPPTERNAIIGRAIIRRTALSLAMGENKIIKLDIADIGGFLSALDIFNAVGNGQMLVDWRIIERAIAERAMTERKLQRLLAYARERGVVVHGEYAATDVSDARAIAKLFDLGFQGVSLDLRGLDSDGAGRVLRALDGFPVIAAMTPAGLASPAPVVNVKLSSVKGMRFEPGDVIDLEIPQRLTREQVREFMAYLPLANTILFHSGDAGRLIGTRDILDNNAFASLIGMLLNFGKADVATPEKARRLGYHWEARDLPPLLAGEAGKKQLEALEEGRLEESGLSPDSAAYEQAAELAPELKQAFLAAIAGKMLIRERLARENRALARDYDRGRFRFAVPLHEEMLGDALREQATMPADRRARDADAAKDITAGARDTLDSLLLGLHNGIRNGRAEEGAVAAVIDIILREILMENRLRKPLDRKQGTLDIRTVNGILSAA